jgi:hypothetical protein
MSRTGQPRKWGWLFGVRCMQRIETAGCSEDAQCFDSSHHLSSFDEACLPTFTPPVAGLVTAAQCSLPHHTKRHGARCTRVSLRNDQAAFQATQHRPMLSSMHPPLSARYRTTRSHAPGVRHTGCNIYSSCSRRSWFAELVSAHQLHRLGRPEAIVRAEAR